jgi:hypothetical protein
MGEEMKPLTLKEIFVLKNRLTRQRTLGGGKPN